MTTEQLNNEQEWAAILALKEGKPIQENDTRFDERWCDVERYRDEPWFKHRPKPVPVPPGELTQDEAQAAWERGETVYALCTGGIWERVYFAPKEWEPGREFMCLSKGQTAPTASKPAPAQAPTPDLCQCGHEWSKHGSLGCSGLQANGDDCSCGPSAPPEPKRMVPLEWRDVKPGDVWRSGLGCPERLVLERHLDHIVLSSGTREKTKLSDPPFRVGEISHDFGATWQRAEKPAKEDK